MRARRYILIGLIIIIIGGIYFSLNYRGPAEQEQLLPEGETGAGGAAEAQPADQFTDIKLALFSSRHQGSGEPLSWELVSSKVDRFAGNGLLRLAAVSIRAVGEEDEELYSISAGRGTYSEEQGKLELAGPVKVSREGMQMELGGLEWEKDSNLIAARGGVLIQSPSFTLSGSSLSAEPDLRRVTVAGDSERQACFNWKREG